jgi:hypothetical protein
MKNFDPFIVCCCLMIAFACCFFVFLAASEHQDRNRKTEIVKEAIQKNWTPEQIKVLLDAR